MKTSKLTAVLSDLLFIVDGQNHTMIGWRYKWREAETVDLIFGDASNRETLANPIVRPTQE